MKYFIFTYGCQVNKSDSEKITAVLENIGCQPAKNEERANLIIVNMCSIRQSAVDRIFGLAPKFKKLKSKNIKLKTVLTGCVLKKDKEKFKKQFDLIFNIKELTNLSQKLNIHKQNHHSVCKDKKNYLTIQPKHQTSFRAYVPIIVGCNNFCSYCVVPYTRGQEISRPSKEILAEIKNLVKQGYKEIWLLGENVNSYVEQKINFPKLLKMINKIPGNFWIRFTSPHPKDFSDELIDVISVCKKVTEYINLPVQSGDDNILKKMNRPYTVKQYKNLVKKIRKKIPNVCLTTDIIVGFPGETKKQFQNTVKLFKEIKFNMAYIAQYSKREETIAAKMKDNISHQEKERRDKLLTKVLKQTALENNKKNIGKIMEALPEKTKGKFLIGKTKTYQTIKFEGPKNLIGKFIKVEILDAIPLGLKGKIWTDPRYMELH